MSVNFLYSVASAASFAWREIFLELRPRVSASAAPFLHAYACVRTYARAYVRTHAYACKKGAALALTRGRSSKKISRHAKDAALATLYKKFTDIILYFIYNGHFFQINILISCSYQARSVGTHRTDKRSSGNSWLDR